MQITLDFTHSAGNRLTNSHQLIIASLLNKD